MNNDAPAETTADPAVPRVKFIPSGRGKARCAANPDFPYGQAIDGCGGRPGIWVDLPYPAPECGWFVVEAPNIGRIVVTAAGRADDPTKIKVPYLAEP